MRRAKPSRSSEPSGPEAVAARRRRAAEELLDVRLRSRDPFVELEVRNPVHRTSYRVLCPAYPERDPTLCTCTDFARRGLGTCKHVEAGWDWLSGRSALPEPEGPPARPVPDRAAWEEIDRRVATLQHAKPSGIREVDAVGAALFEPPTGPPKGVERGGEAVGRTKRERSAPTTTSRARP